MFRTWLVPGVSAVCLAFAGAHIIEARREPPRAAPLRTPPSAAFAKNVAGGGVVEPASEILSLGAPVSGVVEEVLVKVGDQVRPGQPLFRLDARHVRAELAVRERAIASVVAQLEKLKDSPRPETLPPAKAKKAEAAAALAQADDSVARTKGLLDRGAANEEDYIKAREAANAARARLATAAADLALIEAGTWRHDFAIAEAAVAEARARRDQTQIELERHTVAAPKIRGADGQPSDLRVWQLAVRPGEQVETQSGKAFAILGAAGALHVRVDIDEHDIPRFRAGAPAVALVRGGDGTKLPLTFARVEPYVIPKKSLTGDSAERVDTRVLQTLFALPPEAKVYVGQQVDVYVDLTGSTTTAPDTLLRNSAL